jgi:hypothetical protein
MEIGNSILFGYGLVFPRVLSDVFMTVPNLFFNIKITVSVKHNYFIVTKVSYKKLQHVSANRPSSGEVDIKYSQSYHTFLDVFYIDFA